jgi:hypothetical protein
MTALDYKAIVGMLRSDRIHIHTKVEKLNGKFKDVKVDNITLLEKSDIIQITFSNYLYDESQFEKRRLVLSKYFIHLSEIEYIYEYSNA